MNARQLVALALAAVSTTSAASSRSREAAGSTGEGQASERLIRVLISADTRVRGVAAPQGFVLTDGGGALVARGKGGEGWRIEQDGRRVRAVRPDGVPTVWLNGPIRAHAVNDGLLSVGGKPYRGDFVFSGGDSGIVAINVLPIDDYLQGVVPLEIGDLPASDAAAVEAQAITARSYAYIHLDMSRSYDLTGSVLDQLYGGAAAETAVASQAIEATHALVLKYAGRVVNAPYHAVCGGSTAAASEIWRSNDEPYLQSVSDQIPGTSRYYCDLSPRFRWTRTMDGPTLDAALAKYLATYATVPGGAPGNARDVTVTSHTQSGRVNTLAVSTNRGNFMLRGNDIRFVLRPPGGEILNSTYFSVETTFDADGTVARLTLHGMGYGHGVGMCQWGAIGRARAGQDYQTILRAYYPGTTIGRVD
jgi:stage II sporulation protein D